MTIAIQSDAIGKSLFKESIMRKVSILSLVMIVLSMLVAACGSSGNNNGGTNPTPGGFGVPTESAPGLAPTTAP